MPDATGTDRLMLLAQRGVEREWSGHQRKLGERIERALLAEQVLYILSQQDDEVADAKVRELLQEAWLQVMGV